MDEVNIEGPGNANWRVQNRCQHYGLDAEYFPAFLTGQIIQKTVEALRRTNYVTAVRSDTVVGSNAVRSSDDNKLAGSWNIYQGAFYAWYADRGDWELQLYKDQKNAFQPLSPCEWMRAISHRLMTEVPSFTETDRTFGGATGLLVSWCPWPDKGVPCKRAGEHARSWAGWKTAVFMYLSASSKPEGKTREICLSPAGHALARTHFERDETEGAKQKAIRFRMEHGSVLVLRGNESHAFWDMTHYPTAVDPATYNIDSDGGGDFFLEFESVHPLRQLDEKKLRPPIREAQALAAEMRFTPLFFNYDLNPAPVAFQPNEQPPPPPPPAIKERPVVKKKAAGAAKKRAPRKKRALEEKKEAGEEEQQQHE